MSPKALFASITLALTAASSVFAQPGGAVDVFPAQEWDQRAQTGEKINPFGLDLLGDSIDPHSGGLSFSHTDIALPGNSGLEVALRRSLISGYYHSLEVDAEFGDWTYDVPRLQILVDGIETIPEWQGARCNNPSLGMAYPPGASSNSKFFPSEYTNGLQLEVPGKGAQQVLKKRTDISIPFPTSAKYVTGDNWYLTCLSLGGGQEGFIAHAPNGDEYRFDKFIQKRAQDLGTVKIDGGNAGAGSTLPRVRAMLMATQVTDVNGNWVKYDYDANGRLTKIHANDGRQITLAYSVSGASNVVSSATANGRTWTYNYRTVLVSDLFRDEYNSNKKELSSVTLPDGRSWSFSLGKMSARTSPGEFCWNVGGNLSLTHPSGVTGSFDIEEIRHRRGWAEWEAIPTRCSGAFGSPNPPQYEDLDQGSVETMAVTSKTISGPRMPNSTWTFTYESDMEMDRYPAGHQFAGHPIADSENDPTNWTKVVEPNGSETTYYHFWNVQYGVTPGGKLDRKEVRTAPAGTLLRTESYDYIMTSGYGSSYVDNAGLQYPPMNQILRGSASHTGVRVSKAVIDQDGDTYTTDTSFNTDKSSPTFSYGNPIKTESFSGLTINLGRPKRTVDTTYEHNMSQWVLGLPKTVSQNGHQMASYTYDSLGRLTREDRHGQLYATFAYNGDGTVSSITDALSRTSQAQNWKRGTPQKVVRPDLTYYEQFVDNNGWMTSSRDPMGRVTSYSRDNMGRLTLINPTGSWTNTSIGYSFSGGGVTQTITKGNARTTLTHDGLFRPVLTRTQDLSSGWSSYVNTDYYSSGKVEFTSQPSTSSTHNQGTRYTYDGLDRVLTEVETAANATTTHTYHPSHLRIVTDPTGRYTNYWSYGWGGPENTEYRNISSGDGTGHHRRTGIYLNVWGQLERLRHFKPPLNGPTDQSHYYTYDSQHRLCRYSTPEGGDTLYEYDAAGQMTAYQKGLTHAGASGSCGVPSGSALVSQSYDTLGRPTLTNYTDGGTPDISRTYDANSNLLTLNRGGINWTYAYNTRDLLTAETLSVDGLTFPISYTYNNDGNTVSTNFPNGMVIDHGVDGLGRSTRARHGSLDYASNATYHPDGSLAGMTYGTGQILSRTLNNRQLTQRLLTNRFSVKAVDLTYTYDQAARITAITDGAVSGNNRAFTYDGAGQLKTASGPWGSGTISYDPLGNITSRTLGSRTITLNYDYTKHRVSQSIDTGSSGTRTVAYDNRGNVTSLGSMAMTYDMSDQPRNVSGSANGRGATNGSFAYDGNFKRVKAVMNGRTTYNVFNRAGRLVHVRQMAYSGQPEIRSDYISAGGQSVARVTDSGTVYYSHPDHLGSAVTVMRSYTGTGQDGLYRERYTPFGIALDEPWVLADQASFTGHIKDNASALTYMQARYYDPIMGRFLSQDPATFLETGDPRFYNRYMYAFNDPVNMWDPDGMHTECASLASTGNTQACFEVSGVTGENFETENQAVEAIGNAMNEMSATENGVVAGAAPEYGAAISKTEDGYQPTVLVTDGSNESVNINDVVIGSSNPTAAVHSHGNSNLKSDNQLSRGDYESANFQARVNGVNNHYTVTPSGFVHKITGDPRPNVRRIGPNQHKFDAARVRPSNSVYSDPRE